MNSHFIISGRSNESWEEARPVILGEVLREIPVADVSMVETPLRIEFHMPLHHALKAFDIMVRYFNEKYTGPAVNFNLEVRSSAGSRL